LAAARREFAAAKPHAENAPRLAAGDLRPQQTRAIVALHRLHLTAGVEHNDGQRLQLKLSPFFERLVDDDRGLLERQS
jgi:hypothetical protein